MAEVMEELTSFSHLDSLSREYGIRPDILVKTFLLEKAFHQEILATDSADERVRQYNELYSEVYRLRREGAQGEPQEGTASQYARLVQTFRRELAGKSVVDVGCGTGLFLSLISRLLPHGDLCGIDTADVSSPEDARVIQFLTTSVIDFRLNRTFDVVYSHQVLEHIAPADLPTHLRSIHSALRPGGTFILILPNKYWGPQDITRIVDNTFTGRVPAMGSHLNESSYSELMPQLEAFGFRNIKTVLPLATFIPPLRNIRVRPWLNKLLESDSGLRRLANLIRVKGRPIFKNPIILISERT
jgi:2-polyprenyl-3-methyl-5-hydroxy-6-metoxy-1,4-benzoquinol methylase